MTVLGPGLLEIGATGTAVDVSCLVNNVRIAADKDEGDSVTKLCGTQVPGAVTYNATLSGNIDIDPEAADDGLFALSWASPGTQQPFTFVPNSAEGTSASGMLVIDPLDFGADEFGETLASDFEFTIVGDVTFTYGTGATAVFRTGRPIQRPRIAFAP
jgi:hypothetical protein